MFDPLFLWKTSATQWFLRVRVSLTLYTTAQCVFPISPSLQRYSWNASKENGGEMYFPVWTGPYKTIPILHICLVSSGGLFATESVWRNDSLTRTNWFHVSVLSRSPLVFVLPLDSHLLTHCCYCVKCYSFCQHAFVVWMFPMLLGKFRILNKSDVFVICVFIWKVL